MINNQNRGSNIVNLMEYRSELELLKQEYQDLYQDLIGQGKGEVDAMTIVRHIQSQEENYFRSVKDDKPRLHFTVEWLQDNLNWDSLSDKQKTEVLWNLGMNVKYGERWYAKDERVRNEDGKDGNMARVQSIVYGYERLDDDWINLRFDDFSKVSSEEAQDWRRRKNGGSLKIKGRK